MKAPTLSPEERLNLEEYDRIAEDFDADSPPVWLDDMSGWFARMMASKKILDAGCGTGRATRLFLESGVACVGIDISPGMLKVARRNLSDWVNSGEAHFLQMDMAALAFPDSSFDGFVSTAALMHVPRPKLLTTFQELYRVVRKNGMGFIATPHGKFSGVKEFDDGSRNFYSVIPSEELLEDVEQAGFRSIAQRIDGDPSFPMFISIVRKW